MKSKEKPVLCTSPFQWKSMCYERLKAGFFLWNGIFKRSTGKEMVKARLRQASTIPRAWILAFRLGICMQFDGAYLSRHGLFMRWYKNMYMSMWKNALDDGDIAERGDGVWRQGGIRYNEWKLGRS